MPFGERFGLRGAASCLYMVAFVGVAIRVRPSGRGNRILEIGKKLLNHEAEDKVACKNKSSRWSHAELMKRAAQLEIPALAELFLRWAPLIDHVIRLRGRRLEMEEAQEIRRRILDRVCDRGDAFSSADELERWIRRSASRRADRKALSAFFRRIVLVGDTRAPGTFAEGGSSERPPCEIEAWRFAREAKKRVDERSNAAAPKGRTIAAVLAGVGVAASLMILVIAANGGKEGDRLATLELVAREGEKPQLLHVRKGQSLETDGGHGTVAVLGNNRVGLAPDTKLSFSAVTHEKLEVKLERGSVAGQLASGKKGRVLEVQSGRVAVLIGAGEVAVKRVGDQVEVRVASGGAQVLHDGLSVDFLRAPQIVRLSGSGRVTFVAAGDTSFEEVDALLRKNPKSAALP